MLSNLLAGIDVGIAVNPILYCSFDFGALLLLGVVLFNYLFVKRVKNRYTALYMVMLALSLAVAGTDVLYLVTKHVFHLPDAVHDTFGLLFYLSYLSTGIVFLVYALSIVYEHNKIPKKYYIAANVLFILGIVGVIMSAVYNYGYPDGTLLGTLDGQIVAEIVVNNSIIGALLAAMLVTIKHRNALKLHHRINVYLFLAFNIVAILMQMLIEHFHIVAFALSTADLLLYVTLQRPEDELDSVSGMFNSKSFIRRAHEKLAGGEKFIVFAAEINNIAVVNSSFGFKGGNEVIAEVCKRLKVHLPKSIYLYRLGGVRFAIIFRNEQDYNNFLPGYFAAFDDPFEICGTRMRMAATACRIDMPEVTDKVSDVEDIIKYYRSSAKSSDKVLVTDSEVVAKSRRREQVDYAIQRAIKNRAFEVYYQPIYSVASDKINSCEALIRLNDPDMGFIGPDEFIPIAEQTGRIVEVGRFVMEEVCKFLKEDKPEKYGLEFVDVNLSVIQCMHPEIIEDINNILTEYGISRERVNLEVTETASAQSYAILQSRLNELHQNGFTISLDDFGTGFSSVEYLINFPFDIVKLDKSLVWAYMSTKKYEPILKHYMPMLHGLGTRIVAEGVETQEMVEALKKLGCDYLQGYYYSRPIPKDKFMEYLKKGSEDEKLA